MGTEKLKIFLYSIITIVGFSLLVPTVHAESLKKTILGKWKLIGNTDTVEFFEDGTIILEMEGGGDVKTIIGDYRFLDQNRIRVDFQGIFEMGGPQVTKISIDNNDKLILNKLFDDRLELKRITKSTQIYLDGLALYKKEKFNEAANLFEKAANLGEPGAQDKLGFMYYNGTGVEKNYRKAFQWAQKAAKQEIASSQRLLGYIYSEGYGTKKNIENSISWYTKAADQGDIYSQNNLAWLYATSENPKYRNGELAVKYAKMANSQKQEKWYINSTLAAAYARVGQFDKAVNTYKKAMRLLNWDNELSPEKKKKKLEEAEIFLSLYQSGQPYDASYDLEKAVAKRKEEQKKAEEERKKMEEEARRKKQREYQKRLAEQEKQRKEQEELRKREVEQKIQKEARIAALKSEYMIPTKTLSIFELVGMSSQIRVEVKDTEILWMSRYIFKEQKVKTKRRKESPDEKPNWKKRVIWFGKINNIHIIDRTAFRLGRPSKYPCFSLQINNWDVICGDDGEIHRLYYELINAILEWYDKYAEVTPKRPSFLSKSLNVREEEEARKKRLIRLSNGFSGKWVGSYNCGQGITGLTLSIKTNSTVIEATFNFFPSQQNTKAKSGSFSLSGRFSEDGSFNLQPKAWINRPKGYRMVGMSGKISDEFKKLESVNHSRCSFQLVKQ